MAITRSGELGVAKPSAEGGEVLALKRHRSNGIADVGVEAGGNENEVRREGDDGVERSAEGRRAQNARVRG